MLERARHIQTRWGEPMDPATAGETAFLLAQALLETRSSPDRAHALVVANEARARLEAVGVRGRRELRQVLAWLEREGKR